MTEDNNWEKFYQNTSLEKISWQHAKDDYLKEIINSGLVSSGQALDLGCGTGMKSIFLAQNGFRVTGIDISQTAIDHAKSNAKKAKVQAEFVAADATDLSFLKGKKFDFVLDWANLHGIAEEKRTKYVAEVANHTKKGGKLLLRCFGRAPKEKSFTQRPMGKISLFLKEDVEKLFCEHFRILRANNSSKPGGENPPGKFFFEFLMERI